MKISKITYTILLFLIFTNIIESFAQQDVHLNGTAKSTETVGEFTGRLNVSIPIGSITSGRISVPVGISYVGNGLKPNEPSSIIGNGWALNEVATIYKTNMHMEDTYRYLNKTLCVGTPLCDLSDYTQNVVDGAYDIYTFNLFGYNGKFIHDPVQNQCTILNKSEVKIERTGVTNFKATLPDGTIILLSRDWLSCFEDNEHSQVWYADNIFSYDYKDTIRLTYDAGAYKYLTLIDANFIKEGSYNSSQPSHKTDYEEIPSKRLKKIEGKNDSLTFHYVDRTEFSFYECNNRPALKCNLIKYYNGNECVENILNSDYFQDATGNSTQVRLFELKVRKCGSTTDTLPSYKFEYYGGNNPNNSQFAPSLTTTGIDAWGYYNGATNNPIHNMTPSYVNGGAANRNADFASTRTGVLKKITYPTGGSKSFEYEQNTYNTNVNEVTTLFYLETCDVAIYNCNGWLSSSTGTVYLDNQIIQTGALTLQVENYGGQGGGNLYFYIKNSSNQLLHTISLNSPLSDSYQINLADIKDNAGNPILIPSFGYIFELTTYNAAGYATCNYIFQGNQFSAGGLRVSKVTSSNGNTSQDIVTNYTYGQGTLYQTPRFYEYFAGRHIYFNRTTKDENIITDYHVGYHKVTVTSPGNGKIIKNFKATFVPQYELQGGFNARIVTDKLSEGIGALLSEEVYDNANILIKKDSFQYETVIHQSLPMNHNYFARFGSFLSGYDYYGYHYKLKVYTHRPKKILNYYYGNLTTTTEYTYGHSHTIQPNIIKSTTGNGDITEIYTDYTNNYWQNNNVKNYFISKNIIIPYTSEKYENGKPIQGETDDFSYYTSSGAFVGVNSNHASNIVKLSKKFVGQYDGVSNSAIIKPEEYACHEYTTDGFIKLDQRVNWPMKSYTYDGRERLTSVNQNGFVSSTTYLGNSNLIQRSTNVDGTYTDFTYDGLLRIKTKTSQPAGVVSEYFYLYYSQTSGMNSVKTKTTYPLVSGSAVNIVENITYSDKLGRKVAIVAIKGSPSQKDVITCYEYDNQGRLIKEYLPVETVYNDGTYIAPGSTNITSGQVWKFTETKYEASPLSRIKETIPPDWNYPTKREYALNLTSDNVLHQSGSTYALNKLIKTTEIDGNGNRNISFTDFKGRLILSRKTDANDTPSKRRDTYTHYDNKNRVIRVIPPDATSSMPETIYQYTYDNEDKLISKKVPGCGVVNFYYNNKDLLAVQQDAVQASKSTKEWLVYAYDTNGRLLKSGLNIGNNIPTLDNPSFNTVYNENIYGTTTIDKDKIKTNKTNILGTSNTLNTVYTYDSRGRVQNYTSNNIQNLTASNVTSFVYDNADNVLSVTTPTSVTIGGTTSTHTIISSTTYDHRGRSIDDNFKYNTGAVQTLSTNVYNWRNELIRVRQGKFNTTTYLQDIDYSYRSNGLLEKINDYLSTSTSGDLFYMQLYYDNPIAGTTATARKNGELTNIKWQRRNATIVGGLHSYTYNEFGELLTNDFSTMTSSTGFTSTAKFDETFSYSGKYGKITSLTRRNDAGAIIDNLTYNYVSNSPRVANINDASGNSAGHNQNGQLTTGNIYTYDDNGNQKKDPYRGVTNINYNHLNLPVFIDFGGTGKKVEMTYDAAGNMLTKKIFNTGAVLLENRTYNNGMEFVAYGTGNQTLELIHHAQGYYRQVTSGVFRHEYVIKDHLGNTRIVYSDANNDGSISQTEILDENHYYAYGMEMSDPSYLNNSIYKYKFNGIERTESIGLNIDMAFYRGMDPTTGRWMQVDPKAEAAGFGMSPYCAMGNNPVSNVDPNGDLPFVVFAVAAAIGGVGNLYSNWGSTNSFADGLSYFVNGAVGGAVSVVNPLAGAAITGGANLVTDAINGTLSNAIADGRLVEHVLWSAVEGIGVSGAGSAANNLATRFGWLEYGSIGQLSASEIAALQLPKETVLTTTLAPTAHVQKVVSSLPSSAAIAAKTVNPSTLIRTEVGRTWTSSTKNVAEIMNSAKTQGILKPVDVFVHNGKSYIINGHHRVNAAMRLGQDVPVNYLSSPGNYSNIFELQNAAYKASLSPFKVDGRMLNTLLK